MNKVWEAGRARKFHIPSAYVREHMQEEGLTFVQIARDIERSAHYVRQNLIGGVDLDPNLALLLADTYGWDEHAILREYRVRQNLHTSKLAYFSIAEQVEIYERYKSGTSVKELQKEYGVHEWLIYKAINKAKIVAGVGEGSTPQVLNNALYPNIEAWRVEHGLTRTKFAELLGIKAGHLKSTLYEDEMKRRELYKDLIDVILSITGLTYEKAFEINKKGGGAHWK